jgi:hypothetical protein
MAVGIGTVTLIRGQVAWPWYVLLGSVITLVVGMLVGLLERERSE